MGFGGDTAINKITLMESFPAKKRKWIEYEINILGFGCDRFKNKITVEENFPGKKKENEYKILQN